MKADTGLKGQEYSWGANTIYPLFQDIELTMLVGSIFYFGYLVAEFPANVLIQKLPVGRFLASSVIAWGGIVMCLGAAKNAPGLMVLRFIMGALEAPLFPSCSIITVMWYKKKEQPLRVTLWYSGLSSVSSDQKNSPQPILTVGPALYRYRFIWHWPHQYLGGAMETLVHYPRSCFFSLGNRVVPVSPRLASQRPLPHRTSEIYCST